MYDCANTAISQQFFLVNGYLCLALCCVDQAIEGSFEWVVLLGRCVDRDRGRIMS